MRQTLLVTALIVTVAAARPAAARSPIMTDRPSVTNTSHTVGAGVLQLEQGLTVTGPGGGAMVQVSAPSIQRLGLLDDVELRLESSLLLWHLSPAPAREIALGARWHVLDGGDFGQWPSLAVQGHAATDGSGHITPSVHLLSDTGLPWDSSLSITLGAEWPASGPVGTWAVSWGRDLVGSLWGYVESSGQLAGGQAAHTLAVNGGVTWLIHDDLQYDLAVGKGLTPGTPDWYVTMGVSARWAMPGSAGAPFALKGVDSIQD